MIKKLLANAFMIVIDPFPSSPCNGPLANNLKTIKIENKYKLLLNLILYIIFTYLIPIVSPSSLDLFLYCIRKLIFSYGTTINKISKLKGFYIEKKDLEGPI